MAFLLALITPALAASVTSLTPEVVPCHGYVEVHGAAFGTQMRSVLVNGVPAPIARWTDSEIVAYLPEGTAPGEATLVVQGPSSSPPFTFDVGACAPVNERTRWRQRFDTFYTHARPVTGPDGTVYVLDLDHRLYAISPQGAVQSPIIALPGVKSLE